MKSLSKKFQKEYWEENSNNRNYKHPVVRFFVNQRINWVKGYIDLAELKSAYDVGCGDGFATYYMNQVVPLVRGGDISESMLNKNPLNSALLDIIDAENLPLKDSTYDLVFTWEVLHHVPNPAKAVSEMARVSKKYVVIFEPNRANILQFFFGLIKKQERGTLRSSKKYLKGLCYSNSLNIISCEYVGKIPPNKTPNFLMPIMKRLPFKSNVLSGISICLIAEKD